MKTLFRTIVIVMLLGMAFPELGHASKPVWQQSNASGENYLSNRRALVGRHCMANKLINVVGVGSWISDLNNLVDEDLDNYATFPKLVDATVGVSPITSVRDTKNHYAAGTTGGFTLVAGSDASLLDLDIVSAFAIAFYLEGDLVGTVAVSAGQNAGGVGLSLITIPGSSEANIELSAAAPGEFDEIALMPSGGVDLSAITATKIKYGFVGDQPMRTITYNEMSDYANEKGREQFTLEQYPSTNTRLIDNDLTNGHIWAVLSVGVSMDAAVTAQYALSDTAQGQSFKAGCTVGFRYKTASLLKLPVGSGIEIKLYKGEWVEKERVITHEKYWDWEETEVQSETVSASVLNLNIVSGDDQYASIVAKEDFSRARIVFPTGLTLDLGGTKVYYGYVCDPVDVEHHCNLKLSANAAVCTSDAQYQLSADGGIPVMWSVVDQPEGAGASVSSDGLLTMPVEGDYIVRGTADDGCYEEVTITRGLFANSVCDAPLTNDNEAVPDYALSERVNDGSSLISINGTLSYPENVLSPSTDDYATYNSVLNATVAENLPIVGVKKVDGTFSNGNERRIGFVVETQSTGLGLDAIDLFNIRTYRNGTQTYSHLVSENNAVKVKLIGSSKMQKLRFAITVPADVEFDEFVLWKSGVLDLSLDRFNIYYAFDEEVTSGEELSVCADPLGCDGTLVSPETGATLNSSEIQFAGAINVANVVDNLSFLVDDDISTAVSITNTVSLGNGLVLAIDLGRRYTPSQQVGIVVDNETYLAGVKAGNWLTIKTYLNGVATGDEQSDWGVLGVNAIGYGDKSFLFMNPTQDYDEIRITIANIASVLNVDQKFYGIFVRDDYDRDGIPDCRDDDSCSDEYTLDEEATVLQKPQDYPDGNLALHRSMTIGEWNCIVLPVDLTWLQVRNAFGNDVQISEPKELVETSTKTILTYNPIESNDEGVVIEAGKYYLVKPFRTPDLPDTVSYTAKDGITINGPVYFISGVSYERAVAEQPVSTMEVRSTTANGAPARHTLGRNDTNEHMVKLHGSQVMLDGTVNEKVKAGNYLFDENGGLWAGEEDQTMLGFRYYVENLTDKVLTYDGDGDGIVTGIDDISRGIVAPYLPGVYTLDGKLVRKSANVSNLPAGVYIVNGVKVLVRNR